MENKIYASGAYKFIKGNLGQYPGNYLEIGSLTGYGAMELGKAFKDKKIFCIEPFLYGESRQVKHFFNMNNSELDNVQLFEVTDEVFYNDNLGNFDIFDVNVVFIDGSKEHKHVKYDFDLALELIGKKSGIIIVDDLHEKGIKDNVDLFLEKHNNRIKKHDKISSLYAKSYYFILNEDQSFVPKESPVKKLVETIVKNEELIAEEKIQSTNDFVPISESSIDKNESSMSRKIDKPRKLTKSGKPKGWHLLKEFIDKDGKVYHRGKLVENTEQ